jgi:hypothetical protein
MRTAAETCDGIDSLDQQTGSLRVSFVSDIEGAPQTVLTAAHVPQFGLALQMGQRAWVQRGVGERAVRV